MPNDTNSPVNDLIRELDAQLGYTDEKDGATTDADAADNDDAAGKPTKNGKSHKDDDKFIPKARFDEEIKRQREQNAELERKLAALGDKSSQKATDEDPMAALLERRASLEDALDDAQAEGDRDAIKAARAALRALDLQERQLLVQHAVSSSAAISRETTTYSQAAQEIERNYPELDSNSDQYDAVATENVLALMTGYVQAGKDKATALKQAVATLMGNRTPKAGDKRNAAQRNAALDAADRQSPLKPRFGEAPNERSLAVDVSKLSDAEFSKLSDRHLSLLRGDVI